MSAFKSLAEAAAKAAGEAEPETDAEPGPEPDEDDRPINPDLESAMTDMAGEFRGAMEAKDNKALAQVLMDMIECCATAPR